MDFAYFPNLSIKVAAKFENLEFQPLRGACSLCSERFSLEIAKGGTHNEVDTSGGGGVLTLC